MADNLFVTAQAISNWERGITPPDLENLCKIASLFEVSIDSLVGINDFGGEQLLIGIDGGGTKTEFVLFTEHGRILRRVKLSCSNPNDIGLEKRHLLHCIAMSNPEIFYHWKVGYMPVR